MKRHIGQNVGGSQYRASMLSPVGIRAHHPSSTSMYSPVWNLQWPSVVAEFVVEFWPFELNLLSFSPPQRWGWYHVDQNLNLLVFLVWLVPVLEPLHFFWDKSLGVILCNFFSMSLDSVCLYFVQDFCVYIHKGCLSIVFLWLLCLFWYQGNAGLLEWVGKYRILSCVLEAFEDWC